jgi:hypothetical protein
MRDFCGAIFEALNKAAPLEGNLEELLGKGQLVDQLREAVKGAKDAQPKSLISLENCWCLLSNNVLGRGRAEILNERRRMQDWPELIRGLLFGRGGSDDTSMRQCHTIHHNLKALIATAAGAFYLERMDRAFLDWLRRAAELLDEATIPYPAVAMNALNFDGYAEELAAAGWQIPATLFWTKWWLHKEEAVQIIEVPNVAVFGETGYVMRLRFQRLPGDGHRLIQHPESVFHRFADDFLYPIQTLAQACEFPVCWSVRGLEDLPVRDRALQGSSAGGAVARAIHDLWSRQVPDDGVLVLAKMELNGWDKASPDWSLISLEQVEGQDAKFKEAERHATIKTVIMVDGGRLKLFDRGNDGKLHPRV